MIGFLIVVLLLVLLFGYKGALIALILLILLGAFRR